MKRYVLNTDKFDFEHIFEVVTASETMYEPTFNAAPGHSLPIIKAEKGVKKLDSAIWGITDNKKKNITTVSVEEAIKDSDIKQHISSNPCIIPASGFYKWKHTVDDPLPFFIRIHSRELLGFAGFYIEKEDARDQFCVLTTEANVLIKPLDDSMPCILKPMNYNPWLLGNSEALLKAGFVDTSLAPEMTVFRVPDLVNDLSNDSPNLIQPIPKLRNED